MKTASEKKKEIKRILDRLNRFYEPEFQLDTIKGSGVRLTTNKGSRDISLRLNVNDLYNYLTGFDDALGLLASNSIREKELISEKETKQVIEETKRFLNKNKEFPKNYGKTTDKYLDGIMDKIEKDKENE